MKQSTQYFQKGETIKDPYSYYRELRPYFFSDSTIECSLTKEVFEYQLEKLSADMKQDEFENFTRQLACRLITPNLIPQTGPTGGAMEKPTLKRILFLKMLPSIGMFQEAAAEGKISGHSQLVVRINGRRRSGTM